MFHFTLHVVAISLVMKFSTTFPTNAVWATTVHVPSVRSWVIFQGMSIEWYRVSAMPIYLMTSLPIRILHITRMNTTFNHTFFPLIWTSVQQAQNWDKQICLYQILSNSLCIWKVMLVSLWFPGHIHTEHVLLPLWWIIKNEVIRNKEAALLNRINHGNSPFFQSPRNKTEALKIRDIVLAV